MNEPTNPCRTPWQRKWLRLDVTSDAIQHMADQTERFCSRWFHRRNGLSVLVLSGACGTGKTHTARAASTWARLAAHSAWESGHWKVVPSVLFLRWPEACDGFKSGYYGIIDDASAASLLIVDDLGAEHDPSQNAAAKFCQVLSRREGERLFTIITTNIEPAAWGTRWDARIADRLLRQSAVVDLSQVPSFAARP